MIPVYYTLGIVVSALGIIRLGIVPTIRAFGHLIDQRRARIAESRQLFDSVTALTNLVEGLLTRVETLEKANPA